MEDTRRLCVYKALPVCALPVSFLVVKCAARKSLGPRSIFLGWTNLALNHYSLFLETNKAI